MNQAELKEEFLAAFAEGTSDAAYRIVSRQTVWRWRKSDPEFLIKFNEVVQIREENLWHFAVDRARTDSRVLQYCLDKISQEKSVSWADKLKELELDGD